MATWADIQNWDHAYVIEAENLIEDELREARDIVADLEFASKDIRSVGKAPDEMRNRLSKIQKGLDSRINELTEYALATAELHGYVSRVVAKRESAWEVAAEIGATISESGQAKLDLPESDKTLVLLCKFDDLRNAVADALMIATEAEDIVGPRYKALANGEYVMSEGRHSESAGLANDADPSWSPEEVSAWWGLLSEFERSALINRDPEKYGNLDGIDMATRAKANELALLGPKNLAGEHIPGAGLLGEAENEYGRLEEAVNTAIRTGAGSPMHLNTLIKQKDDAWKRLQDLRALRDQLRDDDVTLVALQPGAPGENVRAALAIGDVDHADHVATLVPGRTTNCRDSAGLNVGYAQNLRAAAAEQGKIDESKVATIAWMNYHAPQAGADLSVLVTDRAEAGAAPLRNFMTGIHTWRSERGMDVHQSAITHSYGSTTGGFAMRDIGEGIVDDFVYTGSPGAGVYSVETLGVDKEHVWVSGIPHLDGVLGKGSYWNFGWDPRDLEGIGHLSGDATGARGYTAGEGDPYANHSMYFVAPDDDNKQNNALNDLGAVIAGTKER